MRDAGILEYNADTQRYCHDFGDIHAGNRIEVLLPNDKENDKPYWYSTQVEYMRSENFTGWYLVGKEDVDLYGLQVRI